MEFGQSVDVNKSDARSQGGSGLTAARTYISNILKHFKHFKTSRILNILQKTFKALKTFKIFKTFKRLFVFK